jgi:hypothetical protein
VAIVLAATGRVVADRVATGRAVADLMGPVIVAIAEIGEIVAASIAAGPKAHRRSSSKS